VTVSDSRPITSNLRFVLGCGGTGGHIFPAIAIAQELVRQGHSVLFIGNRGGMEEKLVQREGFPFSVIYVQKLYRKLSLANLLFPFLLISSSLASGRIIRKFKPHAVICTGGFVSGPVGIAAACLRKPLYFHESNSYPGITTRYLSRYTRITFAGFAKTADYLKNTRVEVVGTPLPTRKPLDSATTLESLGLESGKSILLVTGGSQGSQVINAAVAQALPELLRQGLQVIWQTGKTGYAQYSAAFKSLSGVYIFDFSPQLAAFYNLATLAVTRAGAMTLTELEENRLPAVLIPLPTATENHQYHNALAQQEKGVALLLEQRSLSTDNLIQAVGRVLSGLDAYQARLQALPPNTAVQSLVKAMLEDLPKEHTC
jgi:UDP-N-acetylglucosamine--N-acetylmuramyl-(pentapeptide) pyrophosphoryl-undecaprenol N-acetylglucosamine transferase